MTIFKPARKNKDEPTLETKITQVVVGVIWHRDRKRVLISQRPKTTSPYHHQLKHDSRNSNTFKDFAGFWEFPGGKIEKGELPLEALKRELNEELAISLNLKDESVVYLFNTLYHYPHKTVNLLFYNIMDFSGIPHGNEGQPLRWVTVQALKEYTFPDANQSILAYLTSLYSGGLDESPHLLK